MNDKLILANRGKNIIFCFHILSAIYNHHILYLSFTRISLFKQMHALRTFYCQEYGYGSTPLFFCQECNYCVMRLFFSLSSTLNYPVPIYRLKDFLFLSGKILLLCQQILLPSLFLNSLFGKVFPLFISPISVYIHTFLIFRAIWATVSWILPTEYWENLGWELKKGYPFIETAFWI